jgi:hypothetical protein
MGSCSPQVVFSLCPPWPWGFFLEEGEDEKELNDGSVHEWICRSAGEAILLAVEVHRE